MGDRYRYTNFFVASDPTPHPRGIVSCVPEGHVPSVSQLYTLNSRSL